MPQVDRLEDPSVASGTFNESLLNACNARFDALVAEGEVCFDAGTTTIISVSDALKISFRLCPTLLAKPVIVSSPSTDPFPDPLAARPRNPFEDPDPRYVVECPILVRPGAKATHRLLINKFPVYRPQILVTTIAVRPQTDDLGIEDMQAGMDVLVELERDPVHHAANGAASHSVDFMGIYNCGLHAGNSQPHKHLQLFPEPAASETVLFPEREASRDTWRALQAAATPPNAESIVYSDPNVSYVHFFAFLPDAKTTPNAAAAFVIYTRLLNHAKHALTLAGVEGRPSHNLIFTRHWMLVVPRQAGCGKGTGTFFQGPQVNAAGMVGLVWMSNDRELEEWKRRGIAAHLGECGLRWDEVKGTELGL